MAHSMKDLLGDTPYSSIYPGAPGFKDNAASRDAAKAVSGGTAELQALCLAALKQHGDMTADEIADKIGRSHLAIRPRMSELKGLQKVIKLPRRRRNESGLTAAIWRAT